MALFIDSVFEVVAETTYDPRTDRVDYAAACRNAATRQGLDPIAEILEAAGVTFEVEQTGGFCMVIAARTPGGTWTITAEETSHNDAGVTAVYWPGNSWTEGDLDEPPVHTFPVNVFPYIAASIASIQKG